MHAAFITHGESAAPPLARSYTESAGSDRVLSCGWRRFQSAPLYSLEDERQTRQRFLKYTPEHMHCGAHFRGYGVAPNTPLLRFSLIKSDCATFRVCLVGVVVKQETLSPVVKKLKLCGAPHWAVWKSTSASGAPSSADEQAPPRHRADIMKMA